MVETQAAATETAPAVAAAPDPKLLAEQAHNLMEQRWLSIGDAERLRRAKAKGYIDLTGNLASELSPELLGKIEALDKKLGVEIGKPMPMAALRLLEPLPGDTMRYAKTEKGALRFATDKYGMTSLPKPRGRRRPHMTKAAQAIKSSSLLLFRGLFTRHVAKLELDHMAALNAEQTPEEKEKLGPFNGVPEADLAKLGARATTLAMQQVTNERRDKRRRKRNQQSLARRINFGLTPGNTNRNRYIA